MRYLPIIFILLLVLFFGMFVGRFITQSPVMSVALVAGLVFAFVTFANAELGLLILLLVMLLSPNIGFGPSGEILMGGPAVPGVRDIKIRLDDLLIIPLIIGWLARMALRKELGAFLNTQLNRSLVAFSAVMALATVLGYLQGAVKGNMGIFFLIKRVQYFAIYFMVVTNIRSIRHVKVCVVAFFIASAVLSLYGIRELRHGAFGVESLFGRGQGNILGAFLLIVLFCTYAFFPYYRKFVHRAGLLFLLVVTTVAFLYTRSRGAYVSLVVGLIVLIILKKDYKMIPILFFVFLFAPFIFPQSLTREVVSIRGAIPGAGYYDPSWYARQKAWQLSLDAILKHPLLGQGLGSFELAWADNHYLLELLSIGLIGTLFFLWTIVCILNSCFSIFQTNPDEFVKAISLGVLGSTVGFLVHSLTATTFYNIRCMSPYWFLVGLMIVADALTRAGPAEATLDKVGSP